MSSWHWLGLVAALVLTAPAAAQEFEVKAEGRLLSMALAGHQLIVPGPLWTEPGQTVEVEKSQFVFNRLEPGIESVIMLPIGENLVAWTQMMGILAVNRTGYTAAVQIGSMVEPMLESCVKDQLVISKVPAATIGGVDGLLLMCGRYSPTSASVRNCAAGVLVAVALETAKGAVKVYDEWCTQSFDVTNRASWPVSGEELQRHATELQTATRFTLLPG